MRASVDPMFRLVVRVAAVLVTAAVLTYVAARAIVPDGTLTVATDLRSPAPFVSAPKPSERLLDPVEEGGATLVPLAGEPVYLDLEPPSRFETVDVAVTYANDGHGLVEIGALSSVIDGLYDMRTAQSLLLDGLPWRRVSSGKLTLYQRNDAYASVDEFLRRPPDRDRIAVLDAVADVPYRLPDPPPSGATREIELSLRGSHRMFAYTAGEPVSIGLDVQDMNRQLGADPVIVSIYREDGGAALARAVLEDDGNTKDDQRASGLREVGVSLADPRPGVYRIEFTAPADVFIRRIRTPQQKFVFADRVYLSDHVGYSDRTPPVSLYATGERIVARTAHAESLQTIAVGDRALELRAVHDRYATWTDATPGRPVRVTSPRRDVLLETDGVFALSVLGAFEPRPYMIRWYTEQADLDDRGIDLVLTTYEPPVRDGDLVTATASFDLADLARTEDGAYRFAISVPGIDRTQRRVAIARVEFTLRRDAAGWREGLHRLFVPVADEDSGREVLPDGTSFGEKVP